MLRPVLARHEPALIEYGRGRDVNCAYVRFGAAGRAGEVLEACRYGMEQVAFVRVQGEGVDRDMPMELVEEDAKL
jgi:hypothetical protein